MVANGLVEPEWFMNSTSVPANFRPSMVKDVHRYAHNMKREAGYRRRKNEPRWVSRVHQRYRRGKMNRVGVNQSETKDAADNCGILM